MTVGVIGVDGGPTTGLAWGKFNPALRDRTTLWNAIAKGRGLGCKQIGAKGDPGLRTDDTFAAALMVAHEVSMIIADWNLAGMSKLDIYICAEDFQLRGMSGRSAAVGANMKTGLGPVFISGVLYGSLVASGWGERITFVQAGVHKPHANDDRLKRLARASRGRAGWVRGKQHARDAWRLLAWQLEEVV